MGTGQLRAGYSCLSSTYDKKGYSDDFHYDYQQFLAGHFTVVPLKEALQSKC